MARYTGQHVGFAGLWEMLDGGLDFAQLGPQIEARLALNPRDANAMMDLATLLILTRNPDYRPMALARQQQAIALQQIYRLPLPTRLRLRLLVIMAPGDMTANTPVDCLLHKSDVAVTLCYVTPEHPLPATLPEHDLVMVAVGESTVNQPVLAALAAFCRTSRRPVINPPQAIARLTRTAVTGLLRGAPGTVYPAIERVARPALEQLGQGGTGLASLADGLRFPVLLRPIDSHGGKNLERIDDAAGLQAYLGRIKDAGFFVSQFVDYRSPDGQYRKWRVALVGGKPFICHVGISENWMIHYVNAGMHDDAAKRDEEARQMAQFADGFAVRHQQALAAIHQRLGLDYVGIDCAETPDGELLVFEVDTAMLVHDFDDRQLFPYKHQQMQRLFTAFKGLLSRAAAQPGPAPVPRQ